MDRDSVIPEGTFQECSKNELLGQLIFLLLMTDAFPSFPGRTKYQIPLHPQVNFFWNK
jgi:hypothetical protein